MEEVYWSNYSRLVCERTRPVFLFIGATWGFAALAAAAACWHCCLARSLVCLLTTTARVGTPGTMFSPLIREGLLSAENTTRFGVWIDCLCCECRNYSFWITMCTILHKDDAVALYSEQRAI